MKADHESSPTAISGRAGIQLGFVSLAAAAFVPTNRARHRFCLCAGSVPATAAALALGGSVSEAAGRTALSKI